MNNHITVTVPLDDASALFDASNLFDSLAQTARRRTDGALVESEEKEVEATPPAPPVAETAEITPPAPPVTETAEATPPAPAAEVGADGIPWDERIHSGNKTVLKSGDRAGSYKYKRGVDAAVIAAVETELRAVMEAGASVSVAKETPVAETTPSAPPAPAAEATPPTPPAPAAEATPPTPAAMTFPELMAKITSSKIDQATVTAALNSPEVGLGSLALLATRVDLVSVVHDKLFPEG